jgi:hypothetical protein
MKRYINYNKNDIINLIHTISIKQNINIEIIDTYELTCEKNLMCNSGYFEYPNKIILSYFTANNTLENILITFFHELAHYKFYNEFLKHELSAMQYELYITFKGIEFALTEYYIKFSDQAIKWIIDRNYTYLNNINHNINLTEFNNNQYTICENKKDN